MSYVEYALSLTFLAKPDPDDPRSLVEQADEQVEGLCWLVADVNAHLEVLSVHASPDAGEPEKPAQDAENAQS